MKKGTGEAGVKGKEEEGQVEGQVAGDQEEALSREETPGHEEVPGQGEPLGLEEVPSQEEAPGQEARGPAFDLEGTRNHAEGPDLIEGLKEIRTKNKFTSEESQWLWKKDPYSMTRRDPAREADLRR